MKEIVLGDAAKFRRAMAARPDFSCERSFATLFLWSAIYATEWEEVDGRILLLNSQWSWQFPLGEWWSDTELARHCTVYPIYDVPPDYPWEARHWSMESDPDAFDYLYRNAHLHESGGARLRKKRNLAKQFVDAWPGWRLEPIGPGNVATAAALAERLNRIHPDAKFLDMEKKVLERCWANFCAPELGLEGVLLYADDDRPAGFAVYSALSEETANVHFEKADHELKGAPQQLTRELAGRLAGRYTWMNREQDMGEPGLRQAKQSLDPEFLYRRMVLRPRR